MTIINLSGGWSTWFCEYDESNNSCNRFVRPHCRHMQISMYIFIQNKYGIFCYWKYVILNHRRSRVFLEGKYVWGEKKFENIKKRLRMKKLFVERKTFAEKKTFEKNKWSLGRKVKSLEKNTAENGKTVQLTTIGKVRIWKVTTVRLTLDTQIERSSNGTLSHSSWIGLFKFDRNQKPIESMDFEMFHSPKGV